MLAGTERIARDMKTFCAKVPNSMLNQLYTGGVDTSIFRAGTLTVYGDQLGAFNQAVSGTIKFMS